MTKTYSISSRALTIATVASVALLFSSCNLSNTRNPIEESGNLKIEVLTPNEIRTFSLKGQEKRTFWVDAKAGSYFELLGEDDFPRPLDIALFDSNDQDLFERFDIPFTPTLVFREPGRYRLEVSLSEFQDVSHDPKKGVSISIGYSDKFKVPDGSVLETSKDLDGYSLKIWKNSNLMKTVFEIRKDERLMGVLIGMSPMPFQFVGDSSMWKELSSEEKRRIKSVPDKTGDGKPDVMLEFFSGGAHCCFTYHTFELGDVVELRPALNTGHSGVKVWNRKTKAPFSMVTLDTVFAYWNASFAESPATEVILVFDNSAGEWRPDIESMKRPAPSMKTLERKAATMRSKINDEAYTGENSTRFDEVFWGEMLKLIYTGHAELAWRYLDMVWPKDKPGKEVFRGDFQKQLELGLFWTAVNGKDDGSLR